jgi:hypothetical protein
MDAIKRLQLIKTVDGPDTKSVSPSTVSRKIPTAEKTSAVDAVARLKSIKTVDTPAKKTDSKSDAFNSTEGKKRTWLQKGAFADGYDFGDVTKTVLGTAQDVSDNLYAGIIGMGEKVVDAGAYLVGGAGGIFGADKFSKDVKDFIAKDLYDEKAVAKKINSKTLANLISNTDGNSVIGEKTEGILQSGGQLLGTAALQSVGVPWFVTSGVTSFGGEVEQAFNEGATYAEAGISGLITAGAEVLTEKISGGIKFGGKALDDALTSKLARGITNKFVRNGLKFGLDTFGEGAEEWLTEDLSRFGKWLTYQDENTLKEMLWSEKAMDEKIEAFLGGALLGGTSSGGKIISSAVNKTDYTSGLTKGEEALVNEAYKKRIAEQEAAGKKLKDRDKAKIYDEVREDLKKAYVSTKYMSMEDFSNTESPVWRNVAYEDESTKQSITRQIHSEMISSGNVVVIPAETMEKVSESYPDLRGVKKKDRVLLLKDSINRLKNNMRQFLSGLKNQGFEFDVNGNILEAKLYTTGINEVTEKLTEQKANMLYSSAEIFRNARYLYSTPSYDSDPNIYRWNYFYTPVKIGENTVGVRIAVRDVMEGQNHLPESQIYNWGIKKDTSLDGVQPVVSDSSHGVSSDVSEKIIPQPESSVKTDNAESPYTIKHKGLPLVMKAYNSSTEAQYFNDDLSKYTTEKAKRTVQKAVNSGILNNSEDTHRMVDLVAKLSEGINAEFVFVNNAMLNKMGYSVNGRQINGVYTPNTIYINVDSPALIEHVVGHEITHALEGSKYYDDLQRAIVKYAQTKGDYAKRLGDVTSLYNGIENSNVYQEVTAELVGEYLFTDEAFVNNLAVNNRNLFQRIWDEIKYISKLVTAGSTQARQLERVKHTFEKAYRSPKTSNIGEGEVRYSIVENFEDTNGIHYDSAVLLDTNFFEGLSPRNWGKKLKEHVESRSANNPFVMPIVDENGNIIRLQFATSNERVTKNGNNHKVIDELWSTKDNISKLSVVHIDEIIETSEQSIPYHTNDNKHQWLDANGWLHRNAYVINNKNGAIYNITIDIAKTNDGRTVLYATNGKIKRVGNAEVNSLIKRGSGQNSNSGITITSQNGNVNNNFSLYTPNYTPMGSLGTPLTSLRYNPSGSSPSGASSRDMSLRRADGTLYEDISKVYSKKMMVRMCLLDI